MNFHDVIRHLVEHGPFASDQDRQEALKAIDKHQEASAPPPAAAGVAGVTGTGSLKLPAPSAGTGDQPVNLDDPEVM